MKKIFLPVLFTLLFILSYIPGRAQCSTVPGGISGADSVCFGGSITLTSFGASATGVWVSSNSTVAAITAGGVVTGLSASPASVAIKYIVTDACGTDSAIHMVYIKQSPLTGSIAGPSSVCNGQSISLYGVNPGGIWSSSDDLVASVSATGIVSGVSFLGASATITYTISTFSCLSASTTASVAVMPLPYAGTITGADTICQHSFDTLRNFTATPGGTWSSKHGLIQFMSAVGNIDTVMLKGIVQGVDTIVYKVTTLCGTDSSVFRIKINSLPLDGAVTGPVEVCAGSSISLADVTGTPGGSWSTSDASVAVVDPVTGIVTGTGGGPVVITYAASTACGSLPDPYSITVHSVAYAVISPSVSRVCVGSTVTLVNTGSYGTGTWSSNNTGVVAVDAATGVVSGNFYGSATITYVTTTPTCGSDTAAMLVTADPLPVPGTITGADTVCSLASITLIDITPSGTWSSTNPAVAVVSGGVVTGVSTILASATIRYTVVSAHCGTVFASHNVTVQPLPVAGTISGSSTLCRTATTTLSGSIAGGVWSSPSPLVSVNAATGAVTGVAIGAALISYAVTTSCGTAYATSSITITDVPVMSPIITSDSFCAGSMVVATAGTAIGVWSLRYGLLSVTATGPVATLLGVYGGIDTLTYSVTNTCGMSSTSKAVKILTSPNAGYITGTDSLCPGNVDTLSNPAGTPGGVWTHTGTIISLTPSGVVTAFFPGTDTVIYTVVNTCDTTWAVHTVTVNSLPMSGTITGPTTVCVGATISLANATGTPGGLWSCGAGGTVSSSGVFTGVSGGLVTVTYTASTLCGTFYTYHPVAVNSAPSVSPITGTLAVCAGASGTVSNATSGGLWSCTPPSTAIISSTTGFWSGVAPGVATVSYGVTNGCGTTTVSQAVTVTGVPIVAAITGMANVCPGATTPLYNATTGGVWSTTNVHATVSATGLVTGMTTGVDTVFYTVTNPCGSVRATRVFTVNAVPSADTIAGPAIACLGVATTLTSLVPGGVWSATNGNATVAGGVVMGVTLGIDTIRYVATNACGSATLSTVVTVHTSVTPSVTASVAPNDTLCGGTTAIYTASPVNGGTSPSIQWMRGSTSIGTGLTFSDGPSDGDIITCTMASNATCPTLASVASNGITMHVYPFVTPAVTVTAMPGDTVSYIGQPITFSAALANCGSAPTYQWYQNGSAIAGATSVTYTANAAGNDAFYCMAGCNIPCSVAALNHSNVVTLYTGQVGVNNVQANGASALLYPNPNTGTFTLTGRIYANSGTPVSFQVTDVMGRVILNGSTIPQQGIITQQVTLGRDTVPGQYMLRLVTDDGAQVIHFEVGK